MENKNTISFYDSYTPSIEAGVYKIQTTLNLDKHIKDAKSIQEFEVRSPQFMMPHSEIHGAFPLNKSISNYTEVLPSVVLNTKTLPWERKAHKGIPWLFLLVLKEDEVDIKDDNQVLRKQNVEDFFANDKLKPKLDISSLADDIKNSTCTSFSVKFATLEKLIPKEVENKEQFKYLNHVREVNIENQADLGSEEPGWFSVVVGNRFLSSNEKFTKYYIHLISMEGIYELIANKPHDDKDIELISLFNYSCVSQEREGESFEELVKNIIYKENNTPENFLFRKNIDYDDTKVDKKVLKKLKEGYTALNFDLLTQEKTFSWYRGPFVPVRLDRINQQKNFYASSNAALIYDEEFGIFDNSYASAWTLGRLLALSNGSFSQKLFDTKKKIHLAIGRLVDTIKEDPSLLEDINRLKNIVFKSSSQKFLDYIKQGIEIEVTNKNIQEPNTKEISTQEILDRLLKSDELIEYLQNSDFIKSQEEIILWFARKKLLYDVPLNYILPNPDYLPNESIRFFYLDDNWIDAFISGAFSIGVSIKKDVEVLRQLKEHIKPEILEKALGLRDKLIGSALNEYRKDGVSGVLLNSSIVSGWKGLDVEGFKGESKLNIVRMDHLSNNILLCIFDDIPTEVRITEPQQALCFGVTRLTDKGKEFKRIQLRKLDSKNLGKPNGFYSLENAIVDKNSVVDMNTLQKKLAKELGKDTLSSSEFALQMIKAPQRVVFKYEGDK